MGSILVSSARSFMASSHSLLMVLGGGGPGSSSDVSEYSVRGGSPHGAVRRARDGGSARKTRAVLTLAANGEEDATGGADEADRSERDFEVTAGRGYRLARTMRTERDVVRWGTRNPTANVSSGFTFG